MALTLLIAVFDVFVSEFGTKGTPFLIVLAALCVSAYSTFRLFQLAFSVLDDIGYYKRRPPIRKIIGILLGLGIERFGVHLVYDTRTAPDDGSIVALAFAQFFLVLMILRKEDFAKREPDPRL